MTQLDLDFIDTQVDRLADGMSVNRERLARDVKALTTEVRNWRRTWEAKKAEKPSTGKFSDAFAGLFPEKDGPMKTQKPLRQKNRAKCKDCGSRTVHWRWLDEGWRLFDDEKQHPGNRYVLHCCEVQPTAEGFDEEPT